MPPARDTVYPNHVDQDAASKNTWPFHVVNIVDLLDTEKLSDNKSHLVLKINKSSPQQITLIRSGNKLKIETKNEDVTEGYVEHVERCYEIPKQGYTKEFGAQISTDGILGVRGPGTNKISGHVIPIQLGNLAETENGNYFNVNTFTATPMEAKGKSATVTINTANVEDLDCTQMEEGNEANDKEGNGLHDDKIAAKGIAAQDKNDSIDNLADVIRNIRVD